MPLFCSVRPLLFVRLGNACGGNQLRRASHWCFTVVGLVRGLFILFGGVSSGLYGIELYGARFIGGFGDQATMARAVIRASLYGLGEALYACGVAGDIARATSGVIFLGNSSSTYFLYDLGSSVSISELCYIGIGGADISTLDLGFLGDLWDLICGGSYYGGDRVITLVRDGALTRLGYVNVKVVGAIGDGSTRASVGEAIMLGYDLYDNRRFMIVNEIGSGRAQGYARGASVFGTLVDDAIFAY